MYTSTSTSLALLEIVVHLQKSAAIPAYRRVEIEIPENLVLQKEVKDLPPGWDATDEELLVSRSIGDRWLQEQSSTGLMIPSVVVRDEYNVLLNPDHPQFDQITADNPLDFPFDPRIKS